MSNIKPNRKSADQGIRLRIRVLGVTGDAFGPGKAQLLEEVAKTGSLRKAATRLHMSYMKAWRLANAMNENFREPLLEKFRGGSSRGGTQLTDFGRKALAAYQQMTTRARSAALKDWKALSSLLKR